MIEDIKIKIINQLSDNYTYVIYSSKTKKAIVLDPAESNHIIDFIKNSMSGLLNPDVDDQIIGSAEVLEIFKVSKVGKVAGSKVINGEINQDGKARLIRDGSVVYNGKILTIFREKNQTKKVSEGLECGITLKDFSDFKKKDIIEVYNSIITERRV